MTFSDDIARFIAKTEQKFVAVREGVDTETFRSMRDGSEITGAPGVPISSGKLHDSYTMEKSGDETVMGSDSPYAQAVEENWGEVVYHNGGPHSTELTVLGFPRIVETVVGRVAGA